MNVLKEITFCNSIISVHVITEAQYIEICVSVLEYFSSSHQAYNPCLQNLHIINFLYTQNRKCVINYDRSSTKTENCHIDRDLTYIYIVQGINSLLQILILARFL